MTIHRRSFLQLAGGAAALGVSGGAMAQSYPAKPVRFVVSFPQGGPNDILGRIIAGWLSQQLKQPFEVDNKPGKSLSLIRI